jgi:ribosomal-protein-alanine N-acetyltransferase
VSGRVVREMAVADVEKVVAIERRVFSLPWSPRVFEAEVARESAICLVCESDDELVGYLIADIFVDVWHLMNVSVLPEYRRSNVASYLLEAYFGITEEKPHRGHTLEVRVSNEAAIELYRSFGFVPTGHRRGYYSDNREDALIMWKDWEGRTA